MPPSSKKRSKKVSAPENVPVLIPTVRHALFFEHLFSFAAGIVFLSAVLFSYASFSRAQEFRASVTATVLPLESYCPSCVPEPHPLIKWWSSLNTNTKLMFASGSALAVLVIPLGAIMIAQELRRAHTHAPFLASS